MLVGAGWLASAGSWCWGFFYRENNGSVPGRTATLFSAENNAPILDNPYRKCYNKCNDNNKKVISHQTGYNGLVKRFTLFGV